MSSNRPRGILDDVAGTFHKNQEIMDEQNPSQIRQKEEQYIERERQAHPELFVYPIAYDDDAVLRHIGIEGVFGERSAGAGN